MNADLHMSDVSSSSSDDDPEENPENPVLQPFRPLVVDPESVLADLAASESDQDRVLDSQGLIVDKTTAKWQLCLHVQIMCGVKLNLKKNYLHDKLPNESIISMLSNAKMLK